MANAWLNYTSDKMIHVNETAEGKKFANISVSCPQSKTGIATLAVNLGQVIDSTRKDGTVVDGYKNILLGEADKTRKVSVATNKKGTNYKQIEMTNGEISKMVAEARKEYRAAQNEAE